MYVPQQIVNPVMFDAYGYYALPLTEFKFETTLIGVEIYSLKPIAATLWIYIDTYDTCGETISCLKWISESGSSYTYSSRVNVQNFITSFGYNRHILSTERKVNKGQMVVIWVDFPIAIDTTNDYLNSDYLVSSQAIKINNKYNWRFYINALIKNYYYVNYFYFNQSFEPKNSDNVNTYDVAATFIDSNITVTKSINVTNVKKINFDCPNSNRTSKNTLNCVGEILTTDLSTNILVDYGDCNSGSLSFDAEFSDGFGVRLPEMIDPIVPLTSISTEFILPNTEFKFDTILAGFEYYVSAIGPFTVLLNRITECGNGKLNESCGNYFQKTTSFSAKVIEKTFSLNPQNLGLNFFWMKEYLTVPQGWIVTIRFDSIGRVGLQTLNESYFEDYYISFGNIIKIDSNRQLNLLFKALTAHDFYYSKENLFNKTYSFEGLYNIAIFNTTKSFYVTSSKSMEVMCELIEGYTLDCNLYLYSQTQTNSILIDYGDCHIPDLLNTTGNLYFEHFGPAIPRSSTKAAIYSTTSHFLIINNEFKFTANLLGFELFANQNGTFQLSFVKLSNCGDTITCSSYFISNNRANLSFIFNHSLSVNEGYNHILLQTPIQIPKGAILFLGHLENEILGLESNGENEFGDLIYNTNGTISYLDTTGIKYRFLINSLIDTGYFYDQIKISKKYPISAQYNFSVKLSNSSIFYTSVAKIQKENSSIKDFSFVEKKNFDIKYEYENETCVTNFTSSLMDDLSPICYLSVDCSLLVEIPNEFTNFSHPTQIFRNESFSIPGTVTPQCLEAYSLTYKWTVLQLDSNGNETEIIIMDNPSLNSLFLAILHDTLFYGIHKIKLEANLTVDTGYIKNINNVFFNSTEAYVRIIPTGIEIFTLENNLDYMKVGFNQSFEVEPARFSYDYDQIAKFDELSYEFFCFIKNRSENFTSLNLKNFTLSHNLFDFSKNLTLLPECFTDPAGFEIDSKQTTLRILPGGLIYRSKRFYLFLTVLKYHDFKFYQFIKIDVVPAPRAPRLRLECKFPDLCIRSVRSTRIFAENQLSIKSECFDGCQESIDILYTFDVQVSESGSLNSWKNIDGADKDNFLFGLNEKEMVISQDLFTKYSELYYWKVECMIQALYDIEGDYIDVNSTMHLSLIKPPYNGSCVIEPDSGFALMTDFMIDCIDWIDSGGDVTEYLYFEL
ncbi:Location of vulva defective 1 [Brachionus plicatilis]|uniref:Location of vulva defective 1 n=1 Tax=Brachionus plicatilis TaxID=10195 RepID=A0A3M7T9E7_BRAPC|nr:Location of vulva defective 1 [Brachionus plicatilis]